jgi:hypothetical protein
MATVVMDFRRELRFAERVHRGLFAAQVPAVDSFTNYFRSLMTRIETRTRAFATRWLDALELTWTNTGDPAEASIRASIVSIRSVAQSARINTNGFFNPV